jgi:hypothetical protein
MANFEIIGAGQDTAHRAPKTLARPTRAKEIEQLALFDFEPDWRSEWWGMPEFAMGDATPQYRITMNFLTLEDLKEFSNKLGLNLGAKSDTAWFPQQKLDEPKEWAYVE